MSSSKSFALLDERIQRYIWMEGWKDLRDAQERAIPTVLKGDRDLLIGSKTASGKTEAAFLPAISRMLNSGVESELIVYISPLKALINDQFLRIERLCSHLEIEVWPWHGDVSDHRKRKFLKRPAGILLITPESLEAMFCRRGASIAGVFSNTSFVIVDEFHAFIGSERGKQLQSLLHRMESAVSRFIPRIALSATLGDMDLAAKFLRTDVNHPVEVIKANEESTTVLIQIKGYEHVRPKVDVSEPDEKYEADLIIPRQISNHLFRAMRGTNNLIFPNRRDKVELFAYLLSESCSNINIPNEFWPHHGSLSKEMREETELALKRTDSPATAICTSTLELGIDIGSVRRVAQIDCPPSVSSLRQRLGRSGRREGEDATLLGYVVEEELESASDVIARLRIETVQFSAIVTLLIDGWYEPPSPHGLHLSTLVQQLLSLIAQLGGVNPSVAYSILCGQKAPFQNVSIDQFKSLLVAMASKDLIIQDSNGDLLHGVLGERFVNHYEFYAAFVTDEEYRIVANQKTLGSLPIRFLVRQGQQIIFAARTWIVEEVDESSKTIYVRRSKSGSPPLFSEGSGRVHEMVRQRMRELLATTIDVPFLDSVAKSFLSQGRQEYESMALDKTTVLNMGGSVLFLTWLGDDANEGLASLCHYLGHMSWNCGIGVEVMKNGKDAESLIGELKHLVNGELPSIPELLANAKGLQQQKWDWALPSELLAEDYASRCLNLERAISWITQLKT